MTFDQTQITGLGTLAGAGPVVMDGATADANTTTLAVTDPTGVNTITLPDVTGTVITTGNLSGITSTGTLTSLTVSGATTLNGGLTMDATAFTVADATGNVHTDGTLDVDGTATIGPNGTAITNVIKSTVNKNVASVPATSFSTETYAVAGSATTSSVSVGTAADLGDLIIASARVSAAGTVTIKFFNPTGVAVDPAAMDFYITVIE
ncbi:MAG: hypothetical protein COA57_10025 [Flavobacteriales bacterium]|nr:MAG: hypothetical protein COA57_10025 [Flavobacteriales bacterium]